MSKSKMSRVTSEGVFNLKPDTQISKTNTKFFDNNPRLFAMASKMSRVNATPNIRNSYLLKLAGQAILNNPGSFKGTTLTDNATGKTIPIKYKKGGKVKKYSRGGGVAVQGTKFKGSY